MSNICSLETLTVTITGVSSTSPARYFATRTLCTSSLITPSLKISNCTRRAGLVPSRWVISRLAVAWRRTRIRSWQRSQGTSKCFHSSTQISAHIFIESDVFLNRAVKWLKQVTALFQSQAEPWHTLLFDLKRGKLNNTNTSCKLSIASADF